MFVLYGSVQKVEKMETSATHILEMLSLKFGMWTALGGGHLYNTIG